MSDLQNQPPNQISSPPPPFSHSKSFTTAKPTTNHTSSVRAESRPDSARKVQFNDVENTFSSVRANVGSYSGREAQIRKCGTTFRPDSARKLNVEEAKSARKGKINKYDTVSTPIDYVRADIRANSSLFEPEKSKSARKLNIFEPEESKSGRIAQISKFDMVSTPISSIRADLWANTARKLSLFEFEQPKSARKVQIPKHDHISTPISSARAGVRAKAARKLKAFELEQTKSARKAQTKKENSLKSLAKSLTVWLNFLFESPGSCGVEVSRFSGEGGSSEMKGNGKRGGGGEGEWRGAKRQRFGGGEREEEGEGEGRVLALRGLLKEICSFDDLEERMRVYFSLGSCKEVFETMVLAAKSIDDGRLKMRLNCPIISDVGMKDKAIRILMSYNPIWLRTGLYIILGGDSLLPKGDVSTEQEIAFLKIVLEKQFFSHAGLAKFYSYNKLVEGLYRPGYYEKLGSVILKRFLLLVLVLDRAKSQSCLPFKYGIDGLDGGSPLLFSVKSTIKSSSQMISDFLSSDVMHGEGNILAHLVIIGYKVTHQQIPITEYEFKVTDLFVDLQDGVRLCRAIQLLQHDSSILKKIVVPSDSRKKSLVNCDIALQYLTQASVPLVDDDGMAIIRDDIANGDKELLLSLLWNMFVQLQVPLLVDKKNLAEEIFKIRGVDEDYPSTSTFLDMLLRWIQATCACYDLEVEEFSSLVDGKAMWCLLDYYFRKEHKCTTSFKTLGDSNGEVSIVSANDYTDAVHNFILSQKLTSLLGNFPEVLQVSDLLEHNCACNDRSVVILLVFLSFQLLVKRNTDQLNFHKLLGFDCQSSERRRQSTERWSMHFDVVRDAKDFLQDDIGAAQGKFKAIMTWWQDMAQQNKKCDNSLNRQSSLTSKKRSDIARENAATIIQAHFRCFVHRRCYMKMKNAVCILQCFARACLALRGLKTSTTAKEEHVVNAGAYLMYLIDRQSFSNLRTSAVIIQSAIRAQIAQRYKLETQSSDELSTLDPVIAATTIQKFFRGGRARSMYIQQSSQLEEAAHPFRSNESDYNHVKAAIIIQRTIRQFLSSKAHWLQHSAAIKIQCSYRGWRSRKAFLNLKLAVLKIQTIYRCLKCHRQFQLYKQKTKSAIVIQTYIRARIARQAALMQRDAVRLQKELAMRMEAVTVICGAFICMKTRKTYLFCKDAAIQIQCLVRGEITRKRLLGSSSYSSAIRDRCPNAELKFLLHCVLKLQRWWRGILLVKIKTRSIILIQSNIRVWLAKRRAARENMRIVRIQKELAMRMEAITVIRSAFICMKTRKTYLSCRDAAIQIQGLVRGEITRKRLLGASSYCRTPSNRLPNAELKIFIHCVLKLQRWWRGILLDKIKTRSVILIQSNIRGWLAKRRATRENMCIVLIQSHWRGYIARRNSKSQLVDLRQRLKIAAVNVDDNRRLINRLVAAVSELLNMRSVSNILHTCETLDMATELSQRCCDELVNAGAIDTLLKLIRSISRSIPDQQILKHVLSTLRNLARYPHLTEVLINTRGLVETIISEITRNKEEGYFIATQLLKKICSDRKGVEDVRKLPAHVKRLHNLVEELSRKSAHEKRNTRGTGSREQTDRRLKEANELWGLIMMKRASP